MIRSSRRYLHLMPNKEGSLLCITKAVLYPDDSGLTLAINTKREKLPMKQQHQR